MENGGGEHHPLRPSQWYMSFRRLLKRSPDQAEQTWIQWDHERRVQTVWIATQKVHLDVMEWSLLLTDDNGRRWIDVDQLGDNEWSLLHEISSNENINVRKMLAAFQLLVLRVRCNVRVEDRDGKTPLHYVCGSHVKRNRRGRQKYIQILKLLIDAGARVNHPIRKVTPLHLVHESPWAMKYLVMKAGADVNAEDSFQRTPLMWALRNPHHPAIRRIPVKIFVEMGLDFRASDFMGHSFIHYAVLRAQSNNVEDVVWLIGQLVAAGADINHQNRRFCTPLFYVIIKPDMRELAFRLIHDFNADVNLCDADGYTVIHRAAFLGRLDYVGLFLPRLSADIRTCNGETVSSCLEKYCGLSAITGEINKELTALARRGVKEVGRIYGEPYTIWEYVHLLDGIRELLSLYIVDTFFRYRGGRWLFTDFFHYISHSAVLKERAHSFLDRFSQWNGVPASLLDTIDEFAAFRGETDDSLTIAQCVRETIQWLMDGIRIRDAASETPFHWILEVQPVGSVVDGTKILLPDEYDFLIIFRRFFPGDRVSVGQDYVTQVEQFRLYLIKSMQELDAMFVADRQHDRFPISFEFVDSELRRVCLNIRLTWRGCENSRFSGMPINVDLTPVFHFVGWENHSGLRPLRSLSSMPLWFYKDQDVEHCRPLHNWVTTQPSAARMEALCLSHPDHILLQNCLLLLKLVVQCQHLIQDIPAPNSHFLKLTLFNWVQSRGLPRRESDVVSYVSKVYEKLMKTQCNWEIPCFVAEALMTSPPVPLRADILSVLQRIDININ